MSVKTLSVTELNNYIKGVFNDEFLLHNIAVYGEVFELTISGGNTYMVLKDGDSILHCTYFNSCGDIAIGTKVTVVGSVNYYVKGGKMSFNIKSISIFGEGELHSAFLKLKNKLQSEGLFDKKLPMPLLITKLAIVTSETGAVIHDFISVISSHITSIDIDIFPVKVQGEESEKEIESAINLATNLDYDLIVIARGGGSSSDLKAFNSESVARCVASSPIPVISAVGHETDYTLSDFCASLRAGTPSIAAKIIQDINDQAVTRVESGIKRIYEKINYLYNFEKSRFSSSLNKIVNAADKKVELNLLRLQYFHKRAINGMKSKLITYYNSVADKAEKISRAALTNESNKSEALKHCVFALDKLSPLKILSSGYAKVSSLNKNVYSVEDIVEGQEVKVFFADGYFDASVIKKKRL